MAWTPPPPHPRVEGAEKGLLRWACGRRARPSVFPTLTPPRDLGGRASCPAPRFSRAVVLVGRRPGGRACLASKLTWVSAEMSRQFN